MTLASEILKCINEVAEAETVKKLPTLNKEELLRGLRLSISGEYEAIKLYGALSEACPNPEVKKIIESITQEEKKHTGEFLKCIGIVDPTELKDYQDGMKEKP